MTKRIIRYVERHSVALLALFVALGGTSLAAVNAFPANSVGTKQLKNGAVTKPKIATNTIAALKGNRGAQGARGATGAKGATGATGPSTGAAGGALTGNYPNPGLAAGAVGLANIKGIYVGVSPGTASNNTLVDATAACHPGDRVVGGGFSWGSDSATLRTEWSTPDPLTNPTTWIVRGLSGTANTLYAWVICLAA